MNLENYVFLKILNLDFNNNIETKDIIIDNKQFNFNDENENYLKYFEDRFLNFIFFI